MRGTAESLSHFLGGKMKKTIKMLAMVAVMFAAVTTVARAQDAAQQGRGAGRGGGRGPNVAAILKDSLKVSDAVAAKADSIVKAYQQKNADLRASANGDMQSVMPKMQELRTQQTADIKALLTDEQKAAFDKIMAAMPQGRGQRPPTR
jgi:periplasmic protein CpxP/Spy